ncbi:hypothetical protein HYW42_04560 [Candidatus Daviesbacteria bacterium]|nr:hypothetical protein [Candidatus Daviesbacteria bacterium]
MLFVFVFLLELFLLYFLSKNLIKELSVILLKISKYNHSFTVNILAVVFLPGTIMHELAHLLIAGVLMVPVGELEVIPEITDKGVKLGSVQVGQTDPFRRILIGVAPVLVGIATITFIIFFNLDTLKNLSSWLIISSVVYGLFEVSNTMFSSKKDIEGALVFLGALVVVGVILFGAFLFTGQSIPNSWLKLVDFSSVYIFFKMVSLYMLLPLIIDLCFFAVFKLVNLALNRG